MSTALQVVRGDVLQPGERSLSELLADFHREHTEAADAVTAAVEHAIRAGLALLAAKELVPHGQWHAWLENNVLGPGRRMSLISAYMRLARHQDMVRDQQPATITGAIRAVSGMNDSRIDPAMTTAARQFRDRGLTHAQIASELGITRGRVWRILNPEGYKASKRKYYKRDMQAKKALIRSERDSEMRKAGGTVSHAYAQIRRLLQTVEAAAAEETDRDARWHLQSAMDRLHNAEDELVLASRRAPVPARADRRGAA